MRCTDFGTKRCHWAGSAGPLQFNRPRSSIGRGCENGKRWSHERTNRESTDRSGPPPAACQANSASIWHRREEVCRKLEELPAAAVEDYSAELASLEAAWNDLPEVPPEYAEILDKRFAAAVKAANDAAAEAEARRRARQAKINESAALHLELDRLIAAGELVVPAEVAELGKKWAAWHRRQQRPFSGR